VSLRARQAGFLLAHAHALQVQSHQVLESSTVGPACLLFPARSVVFEQPSSALSVVQQSLAFILCFLKKFDIGQLPHRVPPAIILQLLQFSWMMLFVCFIFYLEHAAK
jgi:hypothetical protein